MKEQRERETAEKGREKRGSKRLFSSFGSVFFILFTPRFPFFVSNIGSITAGIEKKKERRGAKTKKRDEQEE